ncbi:hypothetical protein P7M20_05205 [Vibrio parahaemolyticus]|nr:hypothetical protein [Vibrio parahaemolyticus]OKY31643.1 hypothetical protein BTU71_05615 [Vibrio parahaemolyticus]
MSKSIRKWVTIPDRHDEYFDGNFNELDGYYKDDSSMKNIYNSYKVNDGDVVFCGHCDTEVIETDSWADAVVCLGSGEVIEDAWAGSRYRCPACDTVGYWYPS